jgi:hypothetical protein
MFKRLLLLSIFLTSAAFGQTISPILPQSFSGWQKGTAKHLNDPGATDPANVAALKEYGFKDSETATYTRDGRQITLRAMRFADGTGGFGGFTYYREAGMVTEKLCDAGASAREHILFYCADILVDAKWDRITAMTMADLRSLAEALPKITGQSAQPPNVPPSLRQSDDLKLALGPATYNRFLALPGWSELVPPVNDVDFARSAEVILAPVSQGRGIVTVIRYPTPHIAIQELTKLQGWASQVPPDAGERNINSLAKRSGPILAAVRGQLGTDETKSALDAINYEADVTWNESTGLEKRNNIGGLVYAAIMLAIIIFGFAVIGGLFFGGFRILLRKFFPGRFLARSDETEFIKLNIEDTSTAADRK